MSRRDAADDERIVAGLSEVARRVAADDAAGQPSPGAWHQLEARRAAPERRVHGWWRQRLLGVATLTAAAACATIFGLHLLRGGRALTYDVGDGAIEEGGYIRGAGDAGTVVRFSDGTRIDLAAGARVSVASPGPHGARLRVQDGEVHFSVMHLPKAAWTVEAGPYLVEVVGTVFDVRWSSRDEVAEVRLRSGSVRVSGPLLAEHATLRPGQRLTAHLASRELRIDENAVAAAPPMTIPPPSTGAATGVPAAATPAAPAAAAAPTAGLSAPAPVRAAKVAVAHAPRSLVRMLAKSDPQRATAPAFNPSAWSGRISSGDAAGVVAEAVAYGLDDVLVEADGTALIALADAARYSGRKAMAERVLRAQRDRFPGTPAAVAAAFFLGRMADDRGQAAAALEWYRRYLTEAPHGPYAAEALGREMMGVARLSGRPAARDLAHEYLQRFPDGTYLLHAQAILGPQ